MLRTLIFVLVFMIGAIDGLCDPDSPTEHCQCPKDYEMFRPTRSCFRIIKKSLSIEDAKQECGRDRSMIGSIYSISENEFVKSLAIEAGSRNVWLGLKTEGDSSKWSWEEGNEPNYTNWLSLSKRIKEDEGPQYGYLDTGSGRWIGVTNQFQAQGILCRQAAMPMRIGSGCPQDYVFLTATQSCFKVTKEDITHDEASNLCHRDGGELATINDKYENAVIKDFAMDLGAPHVWIGLIYLRNLNNWGWMDGSPTDFTIWNEAPINGAVAPYGYMNLDSSAPGVWNNGGEDWIRGGYVCRAGYHH